MKTSFYKVTLTLYYTYGDAFDEYFYVEASTQSKAIREAEMQALDAVDVAAVDFVEIEFPESQDSIFDGCESCEAWGTLTDDWSYLDRI